MHQVAFYSSLERPLLDWLPGDTLFSLCSRCHAFWRHRNASQTSRMLFGGDRLAFHHDLPKHLRALELRTDRRLGTCDYIAEERTILRFYAAFAPSEAIAVAREAMAGSATTAMKALLGVTAGALFAKHPLKACPRCIADDMEFFGWPLWHLDHQYPGVWVCQRHDLLLQIAMSQPGALKTFEWQLPRMERLKPPSSIAIAPLGFARLSLVAKLVRDIVDGGERIDPINLASLYQFELRERRLLSSTDPFLFHLAANAFVQFLKPLRAVEEFQGLPETTEQGKQWLSRLLAHPSGTPHPLRHFVMIAWLFGNADGLADRIRVAAP